MTIVAALLTPTLLFLEKMRGLPIPVILFISILGVMSYVASDTRFGPYFYAIGNNAEAPRRTGIKVDRIEMTAFAIAGGMARPSLRASACSLDAGMSWARSSGH